MRHAALAFLATALAFTVAADAPAGQPAAPWMLVYVGAEDCGPCRSWRREQRPRFVSSPEFTRLTYREFVAQRLKDLLDAEAWPQDIRPLHAAVMARPGAPQWLFVQNGRVLWSLAGLSAWRDTVWPAIRAAARRP